MEQRSREQRRRETAARLVEGNATLATSTIARVPRLAMTSLRGGAVALRARLGRSSSESIHELVASLGKLKGAAMKMGQHLSYIDSSVPDDVRAALAALQTHSQPMPTSRAIAIVERELGAAAAPLIAAFEVAPIASASLGQVHRARLADGTRVAVKIRYPGIRRAIATDFGPTSVAGRLAGWLFPQSWPQKQLDAFVREARERVLDECDYAAEARRQAELAERYADHEAIVVPAVHAAGERVIVTSLIDGMHLESWLATAPPQDARDRIAEALVEFYVGTLLRWGVLVGDPHPGTYLVLADGRVAIVDHGCACSYTGERRTAVERVLRAEDRAAAYTAAAELGSAALVPLRVRLGLGAVVARLGTQLTWRELVDRIPLGPVAFEVVLLDPGTRTIEMIREVRDATGTGVHEAHELIGQTPRVVKRTLVRREAEALKRRLEVSGGAVEIRREPAR